jgi:predicted Abi (CAAX) family protease
MIERALRMAVWMSAALLGAGLLLWLGGAAPAMPVMHAGLWMLIAVPVTRMLASAVTYAALRDWAFFALTVVVIACLAFPIARYFLWGPR